MRPIFILMSIARFSTSGADHSRIIFPATFLDASDGSDEEALKKIKHRTYRKSVFG
jgi:hypothetical protein